MSLRRWAAALAGVTACVAAGVSATALGAPVSAWRSVTFDAVTITVPAAWPVVNLASDQSACPRLDLHAVYLGRPGPAPDCPAGLTGMTETVQLQPVNPASPDYRAASARARLDGRAVLTNPDAAVTHTVIDVIPAAGVEVSLTYRSDPALARQIQSSVRIGPSARAARLAPPRPVRPGGRQSLYTGPGFDACAAPSAATMTQWLASPYRAVGVYIGGVNRACAQPNLTSTWLAAIRAQGWSYFPLYVGLQSDCMFGGGSATINRSQAAAQGKAAADDAARQAQALGIPAGSPIIYDMEAYGPSCNQQVITFLSAWDGELHARGYQAGIYESFTNVTALVRAAGTMTEPDVIHYADWDNAATTTSPYMPANLWTNHQRLHQYRGGHAETYGGTALRIDNDQLDVNLSGPAVPVPVNPPPHPAFRIAVAINANGTAELFARSAGRALVHAGPGRPGGLGFSWVHQLGRSPGNLASNPAVATQADGSLAVFAVNGSGQLAHAWQQAGFPNGWEWGRPLPAPPGRAAAAPARAPIRRRGGYRAVFVPPRAGAVATARQRQPGANASWTAWGSIGGSCASSPVPVLLTSRRAEVTCVTSSGTAAADIWAGSRWAGWATLDGGEPDLAGVPAVTVSPNGTAELFAATVEGGMDFAWQQPGAAAWAWGPPVADSPSAATVVNSPAASSWVGRQTAIFAQLAGGQPGYVRQLGLATASGFTSWQPAGGSPPGGTAVGSPTAWINAGGVPEVAVLDGRLHLAVSRYGQGGWTGWAQLGGGSF